MIARLDALLPPLDPALGFYLLFAALVVFGLLRLWDRARDRAGPDPYAEPHGDVTERPHG